MLSSGLMLSVGGLIPVLLVISKKYKCSRSMCVRMLSDLCLNHVYTLHLPLIMYNLLKDRGQSISLVLISPSSIFPFDD